MCWGCAGLGKGVKSPIPVREKPSGNALTVNNCGRWGRLQTQVINKLSRINCSVTITKRTTFLGSMKLTPKLHSKTCKVYHKLVLTGLVCCHGATRFPYWTAVLLPLPRAHSMLFHASPPLHVLSSFTNVFPELFRSHSAQTSHPPSGPR